MSGPIVPPFQPGVISLLVPSRGAPQGCLAMWRSALDTADDPLQMQLVLDLDSDDPSLASYHAWVRSSDYSRIRVHTSPPGTPPAVEACDGEMIVHASDQHRFHTSGWDRTIRRLFRRGRDR